MGRKKLVTAKDQHQNATTRLSRRSDAAGVGTCAHTVRGTRIGDYAGEYNPLCSFSPFSEIDNGRRGFQILGDHLELSRGHGS